MYENKIVNIYHVRIEENLYPPTMSANKLFKSLPHICITPTSK